MEEDVEITIMKKPSIDSSAVYRTTIIIITMAVKNLTVELMLGKKTNNTKYNNIK